MSVDRHHIQPRIQPLRIECIVVTKPAPICLPLTYRAARQSTVHNSTVRSLTVYSWAVCHGVGFIGVPAVPGTGGRDSNHRFFPAV